MKKKIRNKFLCISVLLNVFFAMLTGVKALDVNDIDFSAQGSITLTFENKDTLEKVKDVEVMIVYIAGIENENGSLKYVPAADFEGVSFDDVNDPDLAGKLATEIYRMQDLTQMKKTTDDDGNVTFDSLPLGLYLVMQTSRMENYETITPFLISVPAYNNDAWIYDVNGSSKLELKKMTNETIDITVKKVWDDQTETVSHDEGVNVNLMQGTVIVDSVTLNNENDWTYSWKNMEMNDTWTVIETSNLDHYTVSYDKNILSSQYIYTITNILIKEEDKEEKQTETKEQLPFTGQLDWPIPLLAVAGMGLFTFGYILNKGEKDNNA